MINETIINLFYIISSILFILGIKRLGKAQTARSGNLISAIGMLLAVITALVSEQIIYWEWLVIALLAGSLVGIITAKKVAMTGMPEMVALLNGSGGASSLLLSWVEYQKISTSGDILHTSPISLFIIAITILIGGVTLTGSIMAWGKLSEKITGKPILYLGQNIVNSLVLILIVAGLFFFSVFNFMPLEISQFTFFLGIVALSLLLGILFVLPIGGGDMPVVISLLNSYSGMAACTAGFVIGNNVLIVAGALVGSSGIILTNIMCKAMNRSLHNVLFSGFGSVSKTNSNKTIEGEVKPISTEDTYLLLEAASNILFVPGYGMAVAQAQHVVQELSEILEKNGAEVNFAIHPVAGRMPGHMNVLLAEANVPYEKLREMDDVNPNIDMVDVTIVIGANDVVNPDAIEDEHSPLYGMPIIEVARSKTVIVLKRSMRAGFAGVENPLFFKPNTRMLFGDAKTSIQSLVGEFKES